jgi:lipid A 3-O-deacylase
MRLTARPPVIRRINVSGALRPVVPLLGAVLAILASLGCCPQPPSAQQTANSTAEAEPRSAVARVSRPDIWSDGIGRGFRAGTEHTGLSLGAGFGTRVFGSKKRHDLSLATARFGRTLGKNWEWLGEAFGGAQSNPTERSVFGLTGVIRYNVATGTRWVPFIDGGVGISVTSIRDGDLSTAFEFNDQLGAGAHYFLREDMAVTLQYRWLHLSNAGIRRPNNGTNTQMFFIGIDRFY